MIDVKQLRREQAAKELEELLQAAAKDVAELKPRVRDVQGVEVERREALEAIDRGIDAFRSLAFALERQRERRR